ncbi:helicase [Paenibacillaceae bacterium]|nr:helicase [Paenibacillaceae bacterium]
MRKQGTLIVQSDFTVLLDGRQEHGELAAEQLAVFAELVKRPGDMHTYRITPLSVWNAASTGANGEQMIETLRQYGRYEVPAAVENEIREWAARYGKLRMEQCEGRLLLTCDCAELLTKLAGKPSVSEGLLQRDSEHSWSVKGAHRGYVKQELLKCGYPVLDLAGYHTGESLAVALKSNTADGVSFKARPYQERAVDLFYREGSAHGGSGVLVLPCGAGKTIVGIAALAKLQCATLILTSSATSVQQWKSELLDKTTLDEEKIGVYAGASKVVRPVTIATYQMLTHRGSKQAEFVHMGLFQERDWGLIIYDEVHLLPAPVFRMTAEIQATRRLGLTATLVREDGRAEDVFSLIGPKRFELPWKALEAQGYLAEVSCTEIRIPLHERLAERYYGARIRDRHRIASENSLKLAALQLLLERHAGHSIIIIGQYLSQLSIVAKRFGLPLLTGSTRQEERERCFSAFRRGETKIIVVSKIANFAIDLPDAAVAIQLSGSYGSRQEEAQRIGRIVRPKRDGGQAWFYTIVTDHTVETDYMVKRQLFMIEQGYRYQLESWNEKRLSQTGEEVSACLSVN